VRSSSPEETAGAARRLAASLSPGTIVALVGPLGAGKTVFVRGLAAGLGLEPRDVVSPTFSLVNEYPGARPLFHADLYRLRDAGEVAELGLEDYASGAGVLAVEWAERGGGLVDPDVTVEIRVTGPRTREIAVTRR